MTRNLAHDWIAPSLGAVSSSAFAPRAVRSDHGDHVDRRGRPGDVHHVDGHDDHLSALRAQANVCSLRCEQPDARHRSATTAEVLVRHRPDCCIRRDPAARPSRRDPCERSRESCAASATCIVGREVDFPGLRGYLARRSSASTVELGAGRSSALAAQAGCGGDRRRDARAAGRAGPRRAYATRPGIAVVGPFRIPIAKQQASRTSACSVPAVRQRWQQVSGLPVDGSRGRFGGRSRDLHLPPPTTIRAWAPIRSGCRRRGPAGPRPPRRAADAGVASQASLKPA